MKSSPLSLCTWRLHSCTEPGADQLLHNWDADLDPKVKNLLKASHCCLSTPGGRGGSNGEHFPDSYDRNLLSS